MLMPLALLLPLAAPDAAQTAPAAPMAMPQTVCPRDAEPLPPSLAAWPTKTPLQAAATEDGVGAAKAVPGSALDLALVDNSAVRFVAVPSHAGAPGSHGGMIAFHADTAGIYRVAIGSGAWIDVVQHRVSLTSIAHGHGPACSGIRKTVDFALTPGAYVLQIVGNADPHIALLIARLP